MLFPLVFKERNEFQKQGDVHGCLGELNELLENVVGPADDVFFVGDLVGKGPDSVGVVNRVMSMTNAACVMVPLL